MKNRTDFRGQSLVEFALILPLFLLLVTGLLDLGRALFAYSTLNTAAREGTRFAIVQPNGTSDDVIEDKVESYYFHVADLMNNSEITIEHVGTEEDPKIKVQISYAFFPVTPGIAQILGVGNNIPISVESIMRLAAVAK